MAARPALQLRVKAVGTDPKTGLPARPPRKTKAMREAERRAKLNATRLAMGMAPEKPHAKKAAWLTRMTKQLHTKFAPKDTEVDVRNRALITLEAAKYVKAQKGRMLTNNDKAMLEDILVRAMWQDGLAHPGGRGPPIAKPPSTEDIFSSAEERAAARALLANTSLAQLETQRSRPTTSATSSMRSLLSSRSASVLSRASARSFGSRETARSGYMHYREESTPPGSVASGRDTARTDVSSARPSEVEVVDKEPTAVLQAYYTLKADEERHNKKKTALAARAEHMKYLEKQARQARVAREKEAEDDLRFAELENKKAADMEAREVHKKEEKRRRAVEAFREREKELHAKLARDADERKRQREAEAVEIDRAAALVRQETEAKKKAADDYKRRFVRELDAESKRIAALRKAEAEYTTEGVDPELIERERQKLLDREKAMEHKKRKYVEDNIARQKLAAEATLKLDEPRRRALADEEQRIEKEWHNLVKGWQDDLRQRKEGARDRELARLKEVLAQQAERESGRQREKAEEAAYRRKLAEDASADEKRNEAKARRRREEQAKTNEILASQYEAWKRTRKAEKGQFEYGLEDEHNLEALKRDPKMLRKVLGRMTKGKR